MQMEMQGGQSPTETETGKNRSVRGVAGPARVPCMVVAAVRSVATHAN
jgi:hypothetical protein